MKKYHVYGMGAALVDTEIEVTDADLNKAGVEKGLMTLVDEARQAELLNHLDSHLTQSSRASGGSSGNTTIAVSFFGGKTFFSGKVANDDNGDFYMRDMQDAGVDVCSAATEPGITGKCLILITPDAERSMNTFLGISESFSSRELDHQAIANSEYVYIESYLVTSDSCKAAAIAARESAQKNNTKVAISFSDPGIVAHFADGVREMIGDHVDLIFCNQDEALSFANTDQLDVAIDTIKKISDEFVITLGAEGALIYDGKELIRIDGVATKAVDTNGAGDMFAGAYLYGITHKQSHQEAGDFASAAAAKIVSQFGPRLAAKEYRALVS
jgi:sugar/nucleoside kinase (ribokinase family)